MAKTNMSGVQFGAPQVVVTINGGGTVPKAGAFGAVVWPKGCRGRAKIRFRREGADLTLGDGTNAHAIVIVGIGTQKTFTSVSSNAPQEALGFAGIPMGGALPQVPMLDTAGATPREFAQIVEGVCGYGFIGIAGFAADEAIGAGGHLYVIVEPILEDY